MNVKVVFEMNQNGEIDIKASVPDLGIIVLMIEKAKLKLLRNLELKETSHILMPQNGGL